MIRQAEQTNKPGSFRLSIRDRFPTDTCKHARAPLIISTKRQNLRYKQYSSAPINTIRCHKHPRARRVQNCFKSMHPGFKFSLRQAEFSSKFQVILFCLTQNSCLSAGQKRYGTVRYTLSQQAQIDGFSAQNQNQLPEIRTAAVIYPVFISF